MKSMHRSILAPEEFASILGRMLNLGMLTSLKILLPFKLGCLVDIFMD